MKKPSRRRAAVSAPVPTAAQLVRLRRLARAAASRAHAPYSGFAVGAAVWTEKGIFSGANVENASYGLTNCAERSAIFAAVSAGARRLRCVVVYTPTERPTPPCGACRQVILEFGAEARVLSCCDGEGVLDLGLADLLPGSFGPGDLGRA
jgi:cytidine deaminase